MMVIEARGVSKIYGEKKAVNAVDFQVATQESVGLLGPNGAGKTSLFKMMYCSTPLSAGELYVLGTNVRDNPIGVKTQIGVVPQEDGLEPDFSVLQNLEVYARYFKVSNSKGVAYNLLREFYLEDYADAPIRELSGGMKRRLVIARALVNQPRVLFLDEPTTGLDPKARFWIWEKLAELKKKGVTIVLTTHYMEEAARLCDRVLLMDQGRIVDEGTPKNLVSENIGFEVVEFDLDLSEMEYYTNKICHKYQYQVLGSSLKVFVKKNENSKDLLDLITSQNINVRRANLEDVFLKITGHQLGGEI